MTLSIYLNFNGNCRQAFEFYRSVFGGDFISIATFGEGPPDMGVPAEERDGIMHVSYPIGSSTLMGSDVLSGFGPPRQMGNNFSISYSPQSRARRWMNCSPKLRRAARSRWPRPTCSGVRTSVPVSTSSASPGSSTLIFGKSSLFARCRFQVLDIWQRANSPLPAPGFGHMATGEQSVAGSGLRVVGNGRAPARRAARSPPPGSKLSGGGRPGGRQDHRRSTG